jgi:hypothetical protein
LVLKLTQVLEQFAYPPAQHMPLEQLPLVHCVFVEHELPLLAFEMQAPDEQ